MFSFRNLKKPLLGVDISSSAIKVLEMSRDEDNFKLEAYGIEPLPPNTMLENTITDTDAVGNAIERAVKISGTNVKEAACAIAGSKAITRQLTLPSDIAEKDLEGQVQIEMIQHIPHPIEDINLDFQVEADKEASGMQELTVVATKSENVDSCVVALERGGLIPKIVDVELFALENAVSLASQINGDEKLDKVLAIVDMGSSSTKFSVIEAGSIVYNKEQNFGGKQLLNEIQRNYGLSYEEARIGLAESSLEEGFEEKLVRPFVESASQEIERSLQLFYSSNNVARIDHILLTGGCASLKGLVEIVSSTSDAPAELMEPFKQITLSKAFNKDKFLRDAPMLLTAFGLAARGFNL